MSSAMMSPHERMHHRLAALELRCQRLERVLGLPQYNHASIGEDKSGLSQCHACGLPYDLWDGRPCPGREMDHADDV